MPTTELTITNEEAKKLQAQATIMEQEAIELVVCDTPTYEAAGALKLKIKENRERVMATPLAKKKEARGVADFLNDICKMIQAPFDRAEDMADKKMIEYRREVERKRQEEARRAEEKARIDAQKKRDAEIAKAKEAGDREGAKNLKAAPLAPIVPAVKTPEPPKMKGIPVRKIWDFQIVDENKIPKKYWTLDLVAIRKVVNALGAQHGIPGVSAFQKEVQ